MKLTIYFDGQFWIGITEYEENGKLKAFRHIFGKEPKDIEVLHFIYFDLLNKLNAVSSSIEVETKKKESINPKRAARIAAKEAQKRGISTQAQQAINLELESRKKERKTVSKQQREELKEKKRELKVLKRKQKHRGR
ncbi:YjdF family protein [Bacillus bombysepticus]